MFSPNTVDNILANSRRVHSALGNVRNICGVNSCKLSSYQLLNAYDLEKLSVASVFFSIKSVSKNNLFPNFL